VASLVVNTFPPSVSGSSASLVAACWEKLLPLLPWCSVSNPPLSLVTFRTPCSWDILRGRSIATKDTVVPMNIEVPPTKYPLSQDKIIVFEIRLHSKSPLLYRPALHCNSNALSLSQRALKDKLLTPTVPLTTVLQIRQVFLPDTLQCSSKRGAHCLPSPYIAHPLQPLDLSFTQPLKTYYPE